MNRFAACALLLLLGLASCRGTVPPPGPHAIEMKRQRIHILEDWLDHPAARAEREITAAHLSSLRVDLRLEESGALGSLPPAPGLPPANITPHSEFAASLFVFQCKCARWFEDVWLMEKDTSLLQEDQESVDSTRRLCEEIVAGRQETDWSFAFTSEMRGYLRDAAEGRTKQGAAEKDPVRHAFLDASAAWWKARLAETSR